MSDRTSEHWTVVDWAERGFGLLVIGVGVLVLRWGHDTIAGGLMGAGVLALLPKSRPLISKLVDKVPGLPSKGES